MQRGQASMTSKNFTEAVMWFEKAATEAPNDPNILASLGQSLCWLDKRHNGLNYLHKAGHVLLKKSRKSRNIQHALLLVQQLHFWDDFEGALELLKKAAQIDKSSFACHQLLAISYARLNKNTLALSAGKYALRKVPDDTMMNILQSTFEASSGMQDAARKRLEKVLLTPGLTPEEKFRAHKELAKILDKLGIYESVFKHLRAASTFSNHIPEIQKQPLDLVPKLIRTNTTGFNHKLLHRWSAEDFSDQRPAPVFLIGFLRSGTTLTQEVLGAHPDIFVADESSYIPNLIQELHKFSNYTGSSDEQL
jgi:tetratricopeptide (TPR) repeat protein